MRPEPGTTRFGRPGLFVPVLALVVLWWAVLSPIAFLNVRTGGARASFDQDLFHLPTIRALAETWPVAKLTAPEHFVAMTPGYHWVLGGLARLTGLGDVGLRLAGLTLGAAMFAGLGLWIGRHAGPLRGAALLAPLLASMYVANAGAWVLTDNAGWAWVGLLSLLALYGQPGLRWSLVAGGCLLLAVWTRQSLLWLALPLWAAAWLQRPPESLNPLRAIPVRLRRLVPIALATVPSVVSLVYLYRVWGGLVPYEFQGQYDGASAANIALQFTMLTGLGPFFLPAIMGIGEAGWRARARETWGRSRGWVAVAALLAALASALAPTTLAPTQGRAGMVWKLADTLNPFGPIGTSNPVIVLASALGGALLAYVLACVDARRRWILAAIFAGFGVAQGASSEVWQRYHEPFALLFLALAACVAVASRPGRPHRPLGAQVGPLLALALVMAVLTAGALWQREIQPWRIGANPYSTDPQLPPPPPREPGR